MDALPRGLRAARTRAWPVCRVALGIGWVLPPALGCILYFFAAAKVLGASVSWQCRGTEEPTHPKEQLSCDAKERDRAGCKIGEDWKKRARQRLGPLLLL